MSDIKSAAEIAIEKVEKLGKATEEERLEWKYIPEGAKLAARCLKQGCELVVELGKYEENARRYIIKGAEDILIRNIDLPKNDSAKKNNRMSMEGLKTLKSDKACPTSSLGTISKRSAIGPAGYRRDAFRSGFGRPDVLALRQTCR